MEKRIQKKTRQYQMKFKTDIQNWLIENSDIKEGKKFIEYIYNYPLLIFEKSDFEKRKRIKNIVPLYERCNALRANNEQCTRRKKENLDFCGTHAKGRPHGMVHTQNQVENYHKITTWTEEIMGIIYYIDNNHNVYNTREVNEGKLSPNIIAKWERDENGEITIPALFKK